jgi:hypothetical protein
MVIWQQSESAYRYQFSEIVGQQQHHCFLVELRRLEHNIVLLYRMNERTSLFTIQYRM